MDIYLNIYTLILIPHHASSFMSLLRAGRRTLKLTFSRRQAVRKEQRYARPPDLNSFLFTDRAYRTQPQLSEHSEDANPAQRQAYHLRLHPAKEPVQAPRMSPRTDLCHQRLHLRLHLQSHLRPHKLTISPLYTVHRHPGS